MTDRDVLPRLRSQSTSIKDAQYLHYKYLFRDLEDAIRTYASGRVLDIGCGNKPYEHSFEGKCPVYLGCDVAQSDGNRADMLCLATAVPIASATCDTVFTTQVLEHVADHQALLREAFRILVPGGYLILSAPMAWEHHEEPYDFFRFTRHGLKHLLQGQGFEVTLIVPNGGKWALVGQMLQNSIATSLFRPQTWARKAAWFLFAATRSKVLINVLFGYLDRIDYDPSATLNFVVVARKPPA